MVIVHLNGGLGNQLFQYAAGRALAYNHQTTLKLDIGAFSVSEKRSYRLKYFNIQENFATDEEIARLKGIAKGYLNRVLFYLCQRMKLSYRGSVFYERRFGVYDPKILRTSHQVYLHGHWQSEKYFLPIADTIRQEISVKVDADEKNMDLGRTIAGTKSVSIHVRRGDYASDPTTMQFHGLCDLDYYQQCVELIQKRVAEPRFFVFSDDPIWCHANIRFNGPTVFVAHNDEERDYEDLRLMSLCKHHILANSSFSWWGAWLNNNHDKIVVGPKKWFNNVNVNTKDLFPEEWIKI